MNSPFGPVYLDNSWLGIFFESEVYHMGDAFKFGEAPLSAVKPLGYVAAGSGYKIDAAYEQRESRGSHRTVGLRMVTGIEVITRADAAFLEKLRTERACIVIIPAEGLDFDPLHEDGFAQKTLAEWQQVPGMQLLAPQWLKYSLDSDFGTGEAQVLTLTGNLLGNKKTDFVRPVDFGPDGTPFKILVDTTRTSFSVTAADQLQIQAEGSYRIKAVRAGFDGYFSQSGLAGTSIITFPAAGEWALAVIPEVPTPINRYFNEITPSSDAPKLLGILSFGTQIIWSNFFRFARATTGSFPGFSLPKTEIANVENVTNFSSAFLRSFSTPIPAELFKKAISATDFNSCFQRYAGNTIPAGLFDNCIQAINFSFCFQNPSVGNPALAVPPDIFENTIRSRDYNNVFGNRTLPVQSLSGIYISLANTIILSRNRLDSAGIAFNGGAGKYDPSYVNDALGIGSAGDCRAILSAPRAVTVTGAVNVAANGLYEAISNNLYRNANGWEFRRQQPNLSLWLLFDSSNQEQASGQAESILGIMPHAVERLGNTWTGNEAAIKVTLTGAGWIISDGGPV